MHASCLQSASNAEASFFTQLIVNVRRGGATVVKVGGVQFRDPPPLAYLGDMKQDIAVFFTAIMTSDLD